MPTCRNCGTEYRGYELYCSERCEEFARQQWRENFLEPRLKLRHCPTCGKHYSPIAYHWHRTRTDFEEERQRARERFRAAAKGRKPKRHP
jgi:endogenous inhibitor of DNA gyrase (YacG/DUF329 family)